MKRFFAVLTGLAVATVAIARVLNVPEDYSSIQQAVYAASSGDTVMIAEGQYTNVWIPKQIFLFGSGSCVIRDTTGNSTNAIGIGGIGDGTVVRGFSIKGGASGIWTNKSVRISGCTIDSATAGIWFSPGASGSITDVTVTNADIGIAIDSCTAVIDSVNVVGTGTSKGIYVVRRATPEIWRSVISKCDMGIQAITAYPQVRNSTIEECKLGIVGFDTSSIVAQNNVIRKSGENGIILNGSSYAQIMNNVIYESNGNGIWVDNTNAQIMNNIIVSCVGCGIGSADSTTGPTCSYNDIYSIGADPYWQTSPGEGALYKNPEFVDLDSFQLSSSSPCINAGNPDSQYNDFDDSRNDLGVHGGPFGDRERTGVNSEKENSKLELLLWNYPNPFIQSTVISYQLPIVSHVSLKLYDSTGRLVKTLVDEVRPAGCHTPVLDGTKLTDGIYFVQLRTGDYNTTNKIILVR